jgi:transposase-like protein
MDKRSAKQPIPETMLEAVRQFADPQVAHDFFVQIRFPNGVACPRMGCGSARVAYLAKQRRWYCNECKRQFSAKVGTIFEDSPIGLDKWLPAIWLIASNRNGISSYEIARGLSVTQKTAWFMLHRIREAMRSGEFRLFTGIVEADETFIGGRFENKPLKVRRKTTKASWVLKGKTAVFGMVERTTDGRKGEVRAMTVPSTQAATLTPILRRHVHHDATMHTDQARQYQSLDEYFLNHAAVNHSIAEYVKYVNGAVHTNTIENFWSVLKRTLSGTYISVRPFHLDAYLDEQICRFNARGENDGPRFASVLKRADGRRLTWKTLTARS